MNLNRIHLRAALQTALISDSRGLTIFSMGAPGGPDLIARAKAVQADQRIWALVASFSSSMRAGTDIRKERFKKENNE